MNYAYWTCGYMLVIIYLCISVLPASAASIKIVALYKDVGFNEKFVVNNKTVTCSAKSSLNSHYPSPMYTCDDIRVDGVRLYHGYTRGQRFLCHKCMCGVNRGEPNDIHALCKAMLKAVDVKEPLEAAYVIKPSCSLEDKPQQRIKYFINEHGLPEWKTVEAKNGYIRTLQCLTKLPR